MDGHRQLTVEIVLVISIIFTSTQSQVVPPGVRQWKWCFLCSGQSPDRECESYPQYVANGRVNCTRDFCTSTMVYSYRAYGQDRGSRLLSGRALTPADLEVVSVSRDCDDVARGNECVRGGPGGAMFTCYSTCRYDYCNGDARAPSWADLSQYRAQNQTAAEVVVSNSIAPRGSFPRVPSLFGPSLHVPRPRLPPHVNTQRYTGRPAEVQPLDGRENEQNADFNNNGRLQAGNEVELDRRPMHVIGKPVVHARPPRIHSNGIHPTPYVEVHDGRQRLHTGTHRRPQRIGNSGAFLVPPDEWNGPTVTYRGRPRPRPTPGEGSVQESRLKNHIGQNGYTHDDVTISKLEGVEPLEANITRRKTDENTTTGGETAPGNNGKAGLDKRIEIHRGKGHKTLSRKGKTVSASVDLRSGLSLLILLTLQSVLFVINI